MKSTSIRILPKGAPRVHPIWVGSKLVSALAKNKFPGSPKHAVLLYDQAVPRFTANLATALKRAGWKKVDRIPVRATEKSKSWEEAGALLEKLLDLGADRHTILFAIGGGVIGDLGGFVAGAYMRGIRWVSVPTTLLSMVDSGIGGKTAVNLPKGKNLAGLFHQPLLTVCDLTVLHTLPKREWLSGLGEVLKYGLACDAKFFSRIIHALPKLFTGEPAAWETTILECARIKAVAVSQDERDEIGVREVLNFGHTIGHAIESLTGYGRYRHGEAVLLGMRIEARISFLMDRLGVEEAQAIDELLSGFPVPKIPKHVTALRVFEKCKLDKKAREGRVRMVLLEEVGNTETCEEVTLAHVRAAMLNL